jgi:hypothetical protein
VALRVRPDRITCAEAPGCGLFSCCGCGDESRYGGQFCPLQEASKHPPLEVGEIDWCGQSRSGSRTLEINCKGKRTVCCLPNYIQLHLMQHWTHNREWYGGHAGTLPHCQSLKRCPGGLCDRTEELEEPERSRGEGGSGGYLGVRGWVGLPSGLPLVGEPWQ